jgi:hypothetical protein
MGTPASGLRDRLIWTDDGVWLQTLGEDGVRQSSYCGQLDWVSEEFFVQSRGLYLYVHESGQRSVASKAACLKGGLTFA